jgi:hypothetical protein
MSHTFQGGPLPLYNKRSPRVINSQNLPYPHGSHGYFKLRLCSKIEQFPAQSTEPGILQTEADLYKELPILCPCRGRVRENLRHKDTHCTHNGETFILRNNSVKIIPI